LPGAEQCGREKGGGHLPGDPDQRERSRPAGKEPPIGEDIEHHEGQREAQGASAPDQRFQLRLRPRECRQGRRAGRTQEHERERGHEGE
jgi:hypothetical protein